MGVVVRRYIDILTIIINFPYSAASLLLCSFLKCFLFLFMSFLCDIANVAQRTFEIVQKSRSRECGDIINYIDKNVPTHASPETSTCEVPRNISSKLQMTLCAIMAS